MSISQFILFYTYVSFYYGFKEDFNSCFRSETDNHATQPAR